MNLKHFDSAELYLGQNEVDHATFVSTLARTMHTQIIGATGVGKTDSAIFPLILDDIKQGKSVIFIDPKGDSGTALVFRELACRLNRQQDLIFIDLSDVSTSSFYNPLKVGTPSELKDKIVGSVIWTEEFYKKVSERVLLQTFTFLKDFNVTPSLKVVSDLLNNRAKQIEEALKTNKEATAHLMAMMGEIKSQKDNLEGVRTDLSLWVDGDFGKIISTVEGDSSLDWILNHKLVYINLSTLAFEETARRLGRIIIQDIKSAVQRLQALPKVDRPNTGVYLDEFSSIASSGFIELLNKARSANVSMTLAHQSLGDLENISPSFVGQIIDNTNLKIIFRLDNPDTSDFFARLIGTRKIKKSTMQMNHNAILGDTQTGSGSSRESDEFIVSPNDFRRLGRGEAVVLSKIPFAVSKIKLNQINDWIEIFNKRDHKRRGQWPTTIRGF